MASFKILVPFEVFYTLIEPMFWPGGLLVKKYIFRDRRIHTSYYLNFKKLYIKLSTNSITFLNIKLKETYLSSTDCDFDVIIFFAWHISISAELFISDNSEIEFLCVHLQFCGKHIIITSSNISPKSAIEIYLKHAELTTHISFNFSFIFELICFGDFHLPHI